MTGVSPEVKARIEAFKKIRQQEEEARKRLSNVRHKIAIISGKGGVGKSFVSTSIALTLAKKGYKVGLLDSDLHGPSIPKLLGLQGQKMSAGPPGIFPVDGPLGLKVVSIDFMLPSENAPVIWRGPLKTGAIRQLLSMVVWRPLDFLVIDLPPGTGDEPLSIVQLIKDLDGTVIVTSPSDLARVVVKKAVTFAKHLKVPIIGIIENMSYLKCPNCGEIIRVFGQGAGKKICEEMDVEFLGEIPIDPRISECTARGKHFLECYPKSDAAKAVNAIVEKIVSNIGRLKNKG